jgi:hypothetical protein
MLSRKLLVYSKSLELILLRSDDTFFYRVLRIFSIAKWLYTHCTVLGIKTMK